MYKHHLLNEGLFVTFYSEVSAEVLEVFPRQIPPQLEPPDAKLERPNLELH